MAGKPAYTAAQFIDAIPGTGGAVTALAKRVGCDWHTAKKYIDEYPTVAKAWEAENRSVTDKARYNVVSAIVKDDDLATSKWWLQVMDADFMPKQQNQITGKDGEPLKVKTYISVSPDDWDES